MMQSGLLVASLSAAVLAGVFVGRSWPTPHQARGGLKTTFGNGVWEVGKEIMPGTYTTNGGTSCYWARTRNLNGGVGGIIANGNPSGHVVVTIEPTDKGFTTQGCGTWTREPGSVPVASAHKAARKQTASRKHAVSSLPTPEQNLMNFVLRKTCGASLASVMDTITGHSSMRGSGEYTGRLRMTPGPHRSTNIYWTVDIKTGSPLSYGPNQLLALVSDTGYSEKPKYGGVETLKFNISYNGDYLTVPLLMSSHPSLNSTFGSSMSRFNDAIYFSYPNCR